MFTGLIADLGSVASVQRMGDGARLQISSSLAPQLADGDSIAVNGVCLTATGVDDGSFTTEAMNETLARSSLGSLAQGDRVNLELAVRAGDRLGGHFVQGHVDATGTVRAVRDDGFSRVVTVEAPGDLLPYLVEKGSVAVDGVSLTISALDGDSFSVSLIPETLKRTSLGEIREGSVVNIEADMLAKHVERLLGVRA